MRVRSKEYVVYYEVRKIGGLWGRVRAESAEQIIKTYPELMVVGETAWRAELSSQFYQSIAIEPLNDSERAESLLQTVRKDRSQILLSASANKPVQPESLREGFSCFLMSDENGPGMWGHVFADSADQILEMYPELSVVGAKVPQLVYTDEGDGSEGSRFHPDEPCSVGRPDRGILKAVLARRGMLP